MDLARPSGIVIGGGFQHTVIPSEFHELFEQDMVYARSLAEDAPKQILRLSRFVEIPEWARRSLQEDRWETLERKWKVRQLRAFRLFQKDLPGPLKRDDAVKVVVRYLKYVSGKALKDVMEFYDFRDCNYQTEAGQHGIVIDFPRAFAHLKSRKVHLSDEYTFQLRYVLR